MDNIQDQVKSAKDALPNVTPTPPGFKHQSSAHDLKARLEWGEPALTILDVRDRETFNKGHILGAMPADKDTIVYTAGSIDKERDIYLYGNSDSDTAEAASQLRQAGYTNVAELQGGIEAWKAIEGPLEGTEQIVEPGPDAYNVVSRIAHHMETQKLNNFQKP